MPNPWISHVKAYQNAHPSKSYSECMVDALPSYKKKSVKKSQKGKGINIRPSDVRRDEDIRRYLRNPADNRWEHWNAPMRAVVTRQAGEGISASDMMKLSSFLTPKMILELGYKLLKKK